MRMFLVLAAICLALGVAVYQESSRGNSAPEMTIVEKGGDDLSAAGTRLPQIETPNRDRFMEISRRPLFNSSRRPVAPDDGPTDQAPASLSSVQLKGITITPTGKKAFLSNDKKEANYLVVTEGDNVNGWTVKAIREDSIVLSSGEGTVTIELKSSVQQEPEKPPQEKGRRNTIKR